MMDFAMVKALSEIHEFEIRENYPTAIDELELRLRAHPGEAETVIRLGFNLWYTVQGNDRMGLHLPTEAYARRFVELLRQYRPVLYNNADFCWAFGLGIAMFHYDFPGVTEDEGKALTARAGELDRFWASLHSSEAAQEQTNERLPGRGILSSYYAVTTSP